MSFRDRRVRHCVVRGHSLIFPFALCLSVIGMFDIAFTLTFIDITFGFMSVRDRHVRHCVVHGRSLTFPLALCPSVIGMFDIVLCMDGH